MNLLASLKKDVAEYMGTYSAPVSDLGSMLFALVSKHSPQIYFEGAKLRDELHEMGANGADILKICLMTKVTGFRELLEKDSRTQQIDLERYVQNAVQETGFNRTTVMKLTGDIAFSAGIAFNYASKDSGASAALTETAYVIPASLYEAELRSFSEAFEKAASRNKDMSSLDFSRLEPLVAAGLPKAKFYLGYCLLHGAGLEEDPDKGIALLQEAADAGDIQAAAALGDYYFEHSADDWGKAYNYYTEFGSLALNKQRREAVVSILNHKRFNRKLLGLSIVLFLLMLVTLVFAPGTPLYSAHRILGSLCTIGNFAILIFAILHYRIKPYDSVYFVPVFMFVLWFLYIAVRLLF